MSSSDYVVDAGSKDASDGTRRLSANEVAARAGCSIQKLKIDRMRKVGIPYQRDGSRRIFYREADVEAYLKARKWRVVRGDFDGAFRIGLASPELRLLSIPNMPLKVA